MRIIQNIFSRFLKKPVIKTVVDEAYDLALTTLRERYSYNGIHAGKTHFSDVWARDCFYAAFGSLAIGDYDIVKISLQTKLDHLADDGQIPLRVGQRHMMLNFMGIKGKPKPRFIEDKGVSVPTDSNSLFIIVLQMYVAATNDIQFVKDNYDKIKKAVDWNFTQDTDDDFLIEEGFYANWADSLKKQGKVLYTNVLHCKAMESFSEICETLGKSEDAAAYLRKYQNIKGRIQKVFWDGVYFIDWVHNHRHTYFSTDGNVLAIIFGIADEEQANKIQSYMKEFELDQGFCTETNYPQYRLKHIFPFFVPIMLRDYHNGLIWLWIGCMDVVAKYKAGLVDDANELLTRISEKIMEYNGVYEVYYDDKPVKRFFYKSEQGFAWSSGLFVYAYNMLKK